MEKDELARAKREYQENFDLQKQVTELERKHQYDQLQLQKEAAGVQAWAAQKQYEYNQALITADQHWSTLMGEISNAANYDSAFRFQEAMNSMM